MNNKENFDCVKFQRDVREQMLKEANYDLHTLAQNIKNSLKNNDLYKSLIERKEKEKQLATA
jgi:DNA-binding transcriptional regulator WhiA